MYERLRRIAHFHRPDPMGESLPVAAPMEPLRALLAVAVAATHADTGDLLALICQELGTAFRARYVCVHLDHPEIVAPEIGAHGFASCPVASTPPADQSRFMAAEAAWGRSARERGAGALAESLDADADLRELARVAGFAGGLTVPLAYQDERFGTINVYTASSRPAIDPFLLASIGSVLYGAIKRQAFVRVLTQIRGTLERYLPVELVETVIRAPETLASRTTLDRVTVLFSDIRDFTALAEHASPAMISELLSEHLAEMADAVLAHHGMVDKYLGDSVMAVFGAPFPQPDQAGRAFCAAVEMQARQAELSARWAGRLGREIDVGIGIHTGPVALGNIGHERHHEYAVVGDTVNVASRLRDLAQPGEILASEAAVDAAGTAFTVEASEARTIRGRSAPVTVYVVRGPTGSAGRFHACTAD